VRHAELTQVLRAANPWWSRRARSSWVAVDELLRGRDRHEWAPATLAGRTALAEIGAPVRPGTAVVLTGPRAIGKSTAARDAVLRVLSDPDVDARSIVWVPVEAGPGDPFPDRSALDADDLDNVLNRPTRIGAPACDGPRLVVIDEVAGVPGWTEVVTRGAAHAQVLLTTSVGGQQVTDLAAHYPGRLTAAALRPSTLAELLAGNPGGDPQVTRTAYLEHGGYPRAVAEHRDLGAVGVELVELVASGLRRDLCTAGTDAPCRLNDLLSAICRTAGRFLEPGAIAAELQLPATQVEHLLDRLADAGVVDPHRGLLDPLLHRLPALLDPSVVSPSADHVAAFSR